MSAYCSTDTVFGNKHGYRKMQLTLRVVETQAFNPWGRVFTEGAGVYRGVGVYRRVGCLPWGGCLPWVSSFFFFFF